MIRWFINNPVAANLLMFGIFMGGLLTLSSKQIPLEVFPEFEFEQVSITTTLRGATPKSIEQSITTRIEEAIYDLEGIKKLTSRSQENTSIVRAEVAKGFDSRDLLNEIKLRIDSLSTLPSEADKPTIKIPSRVRDVITLVIHGDISDDELRQLGDKHKEQLLAVNGVSKVEFDNPKKREITIEVKPEELDALGINFSDIKRAINRSSLDLSAGNIKSKEGEILVRTNAQASSAQEYANIAILTRNDGNIILLKDIATVSDAFDENPQKRLFNGEPAIALDVYRTGKESSIQVADLVKNYISEQQANLPNGIQMSYWRDRSKVVKGRLDTLVKSAWQGGILVILLLALFLRPSVATWVALGIPVSFMGAIILMPTLGVTLNVVSMFAFILALGIVVDDAIVTGENVYRHSVLTTIAAFTPLLMIEGNRGAIFSQIAAIVIPVLLFSLVESKFVLPSHLSKLKNINSEPNNPLSRLQHKISNGLESFIIRFYQPALRAAIHNKTITIVSTLVICMLVISYASSGWLKFSFFPRVERELVSVSLTMPSATPFEKTDKYVQRITRAAEKIQAKYTDEETGESLITTIFSNSGGRGRSRGSNLGWVGFEVLPPEKRSKPISVRKVSREWRRAIGTIPGAEQLSFRSSIGRSGAPIDVQLSSQSLEQLRTVGDEIRIIVSQYDGLFDIQDNLSGGKDEFQLSLKPSAYNLGVTLRDIGEQTRHAIYGLEAQRIQRGRDEISVMIKSPISNRSTLNDLYNLPIRIKQASGETKSIPLKDVATITTGNSPSALYRVNRFQTMNITADAENGTDLSPIKFDLTTQINDLLEEYPGVSFDLEGEAKEQKETFGSLNTGIIIVLLAIYALLAIPFKSYGQPLIVMSIIPIGAIGAILGHIVWFESLSIMSFMGILALIGVVINDSLVLVDYINKERKRGTELMTAVLEAGAKRFRPVMLTSLTTFAGLTPLLLERSTQAKFLQPMAISLGFGIIFATLITLILIPVNYLIYESAKTGIKKLTNLLFMERSDLN